MPISGEITPPLPGGPSVHGVRWTLTPPASDHAGQPADTGSTGTPSGNQIATVTLARPERRNAQTPGTWRALAAVGRQLPGSVRVVLVRGEGPDFSAGLDLAELGPEQVRGYADRSDAELDALLASYQECFDWLRRPDLISVAVVAGAAVGVGFQLALACDLRVLATDARLAMAEITHGLVPDMGGTGPLVAAVGYPRALELCATGRWVHADEAVRLGLATVAVDRAELDAAAADLVAALLGGDRDALVELKALLVPAAARTGPQQLAAERQAQARRLRALAGLGE